MTQTVNSTDNNHGNIRFEYVTLCTATLKAAVFVGLDFDTMPLFFFFFFFSDESYVASPGSGRHRQSIMVDDMPIAPESSLMQSPLHAEGVSLDACLSFFLLAVTFHVIIALQSFLNSTYILWRTNTLFICENYLLSRILLKTPSFASLMLFELVWVIGTLYLPLTAFFFFFSDQCNLCVLLENMYY